MTTSVLDTRQQAIEIIKAIQSGNSLLDKDTFPDSLKGSIAKDLWDTCEFDYGMEYGAIQVLMVLFTIKAEEL